MRAIIIISLFFITCSGTFAQVIEEAIFLETKTGKIAGTLLTTNSTSQVPVVLIIAGSGPTDRNGNNQMMSNNSLKMLAEGLSKNGIASLRYDKRGISESKDAGKSEADLRFENYINDAEAWLNLLSDDSRFSQVLIAGHSEGSLIGMIAAQKKEVAKFISIAGVGSAAGDVLKEQLNSQSPFLLEQASPIIDKLVQGETVDTIPPMLLSVFRPSVQPYIISWFKYSPLDEIAGLEKPILILQGTTDIQVSVEEANKLANANRFSEVHIIEGMNHVLKEAPADKMQNIQTYSDPELPLKEGFIELIVDFINKPHDK